MNGTTSPMWVMELGSLRNKSFLVSVVVTGLPFAGLVAVWVTMVCQSGSNWAWRGPVPGEALSALLCLLLRLQMKAPDAHLPGLHHRDTRTLEVITHLHENGDDHNALVAAEYKEICDTLVYEKIHDGGWKSLITPAANLRRFSIAVL
ncbi:hypothetical protein EDB80DRAFT_883650 [Ilyonectria destructans]|nr:hypothetical protein EDB80DRAFT_883650 [Ilyonectria destructans]